MGDLGFVIQVVWLSADLGRIWVHQFFAFLCYLNNAQEGFDDLPLRITKPGYSFLGKLILVILY